MTNSERASYIKGLMEGMELDPKAKETKLFTAIVELLDDLSVSVEEMEDGYDELCEQVDEIDQDLGSLEEEFYGMELGDEDDECGCGHHHGGGEGCGCGHHHGHDAIFEAICPSCGQTIQLTEEMLEDEKMICPGCGETLEFDFDEDDEEDEPEDEAESEETEE